MPVRTAAQAPKRSRLRVAPWAGRRAWPRSCPTSPTLNDYFVRDDFGVVQLLAQKPFSYFPRWFASSWMDDIWGYYPDEIRPFPALSYQLTALGGPVSPFLHHALNILIHAANGLPGDGHRAARRGARRRQPRRSPRSSSCCCRCTPKAWPGSPAASTRCRRSSISRRSWRMCATGSDSTRELSIAGSLLLFFVALFTKQNTITMVATLAGYDVIVARRPDPADCRRSCVRTSRLRDDGRAISGCATSSSARSRARGHSTRGPSRTLASCSAGTPGMSSPGT